ncbi:hypothetical protein L207DRAFT_525721 [Hyaloscypha variabilis F]|uniref:MFS general substrate transporter n=1 Tax=Hyaloscypha variabilis (strain UAMH 11265 / GT02V1 / F) TaxID=1149755 RepID=A0A2J6S0T3_HYAVF|nr:hypothetical protein L207DRAFT_525721 [Hyaloscypha variabilis F]
MTTLSLSLAATASSLSLKEQVRWYGFECSDGNDFQISWLVDDSAHPRNWPFWTKFFTAVLISLDFFTTMISTVGNGRDDNNISPVFAMFAYTSMRWVFWNAAIIEFTQGFLTLFLKESRPSQILRKRLHLLNQASTSETPFTIDNPDESLSWHDFITDSLTCPTRLFLMEPIALLLTLMCAVAFGQIYLFTQALPAIYTQAPLSFTTEHASLSFIPIAIGLGLNIIPRFYDHDLLKRIKGRNGVIEPKHKIRAFAIDVPILAIDLWWFAWTIPPSVPAPWPVSFLPLILIGFATNESDCNLAGYMIASYTFFSTSAFTSLEFVRVVMYGRVGANKATTILAALAAAFCGAPVLFLRYGERLRKRSAFSRYSREAEKKMGDPGGTQSV